MKRWLDSGIEPLRATLRNQQVILDWKTTEEINAAYYEIQHQTSTQSWQSLRKIHATTAKKYQFVHSDPSEDINYYRLQQVDKDGRMTYSNIVSVVFKDVFAKIKITNPVQENQLLINDLPQMMKIRISDLQGQLLTILQVGHGRFSYDMQHLPQGTYIVELFTDDNRLVRTERVIRN